MGNMYFSACRYCVLVSDVHSVSILIVVLCVICSLLMVVSDASDAHMVQTYSSMGLVMAFYMASIVSFYIPHVVGVAVSALSRLLFCRLVLLCCLCLL